MKLKNKIFSYLLVPFCIFLFWIFLYYIGIFNKLMFPNPISVIIEFIKLFSNKILLLDLSKTLLRVINASIIGIFIGVPFGLFFGYFKKIYSLFEFMIDFFRSLPATALFPLSMLFFGIGDLSKIFLTAWMVSLTILINTAYGVKHANKSYLKMAKIYKLDKRYLFNHIVFPGALPNIFSGLRIGVSLTLIIMIVAEMFIGSVNGLGYAILDAQIRYDIPRMYAIIILTGILGYGLNKILLLIEKKTIHWTNN